VPFEDKAGSGLLVLAASLHYHPLSFVDGAGSVESGAEVVGGGAFEVPSPAALTLRLASNSGSFFFLSSSMAMSAQKQQVKGQDMQLTTIKQAKI